MQRCANMLQESSQPIDLYVAFVGQACRPEQQDDVANEICNPFGVDKSAATSERKSA